MVTPAAVFRALSKVRRELNDTDEPSDKLTIADIRQAIRLARNRFQAIDARLDAIEARLDALEAQP
ncbi:MAG TPA: hypothetical protein VFP48_01650 [Steroidobacteraceae bacterium]|nr:hypothetical protein [Steroidobacteraceae bacterium]